jgi:hypothetical protein
LVRALEATPANIIIAEMQGMTARDSFVMTTRLDQPPSRYEHLFCRTIQSIAVFWTNLRTGPVT